MNSLIHTLTQFQRTNTYLFLQKSFIQQKQKKRNILTVHSMEFSSVSEVCISTSGETSRFRFIFFSFFFIGFHRTVFAEILKNINV